MHQTNETPDSLDYQRNLYLYQLPYTVKINQVILKHNVGSKMMSRKYIKTSINNNLMISSSKRKNRKDTRNKKKCNSVICIMKESPRGFRPRNSKTFPIKMYIFGYLVLPNAAK